MKKRILVLLFCLSFALGGCGEKAVSSEVFSSETASSSSGASLFIQDISAADRQNATGLRVIKNKMDAFVAESPDALSKKYKLVVPAHFAFNQQLYESLYYVKEDEHWLIFDYNEKAVYTYEYVFDEWGKDIFSFDDLVLFVSGYNWFVKYIPVNSFAFPIEVFIPAFDGRLFDVYEDNNEEPVFLGSFPGQIYVGPYSDTLSLSFEIWKEERLGYYAITNHIPLEYPVYEPTPQQKEMGLSFVGSAYNIVGNWEAADIKEGKSILSFMAYCDLTKQMKRMLITTFPNGHISVIEQTRIAGPWEPEIKEDGTLPKMNTLFVRFKVANSPYLVYYDYVGFETPQKTVMAG